MHLNSNELYIIIFEDLFVFLKSHCLHGFCDLKKINFKQTSSLIFLFDIDPAILKHLFK